MVRCDYCGRTYRGSINQGLIGGWYNVCSEKCRLAMRQSIAAGDTREYRNPIESGLKTLVKVVAVCLVGGFITSRCSSYLDSSSGGTQAVAENSMVEEKTEDALQSGTAPQEVAEVEQADQSSTGNTELEEPVAEGEIRTIPPPESADSTAATTADE